MDFQQRVRKTDLARNTHQVIREVQRGRMAIVESHGQVEVAIIDILDYWILCAFVRYHTASPATAEQAATTYTPVQQAADNQEHITWVIRQYLAGMISLARAAELLNTDWLELRTRFERLGISLRTGPQNAEEASAEVKAYEQWEMEK